MTADLVVVGAGPHGLAVLAALAARPAPWPGSVVVVDPHDGWAEAWHHKLARLDLERLRSPQVHHPGARPMQLRDLVEALPEDEQLALRRPEAERVPTPAGMRALIDEVVAGLGPVQWITGRVARIDLADPTSGADGSTPATGAAVRVVLDSGERIDAAAVVLAHNPSTPRIPDWGVPLIASGAAVHASTVDLRTEPAAGRRIAIVGGGLTAATLALDVAARGATTTLLARRPLRARPYDVDASWLGPRHLAAFKAAGVTERRAMIDEARDGGTIPPRVLERLRERAGGPAPGLTILEGVDVLAELHALGPVDAIWLATGFENDVRADPLVGPLVEALGVPVLGGLPAVTDHMRLPGAPVYVAGPYAALGVGPACRNLSGARPTAAAIAEALVGAGDPA